MLAVEKGFKPDLRLAKTLIKSVATVQYTCNDGNTKESCSGVDYCICSSDSLSCF